MDDRQLMIRALAEVRRLRRVVEAAQDKRVSLTLKLADLREVAMQGREDAGVTLERADALADYFQALLDEMAAESDGEFTDDEFESGSEHEDTHSDDQDWDMDGSIEP